MQLTRNFWLHEFERSDLAARKGIDNRVPARLIDNVADTAKMLQRVRDLLTEIHRAEVPVHVTSGYRCIALNRMLGSSDASDHTLGLAVDWQAPGFGAPSTIARIILPYMAALGIGQLIDEYPPTGWIHTGVKAPSRPINAALTITQSGTRPLVLS